MLDVVRYNLEREIQIVYDFRVNLIGNYFQNFLGENLMLFISVIRRIYKIIFGIWGEGL